PSGIAVASDGTAYFADRSSWRVHKIRLDGTLETLAGTGAIGRPENGALAVESPLTEPIDVALGPSGDLYVATRVASQVHRIAADGRIWLAAGTGNSSCYLYQCGEDELATEAEVPFPTAIRVDGDGALYIVHDLSAAGIGASVWFRKVEPDG